MMLYTRDKIVRIWWLSGIVLGTLLFSSCATVPKGLHIVQPKLAVKDVHFTGITFKALELAVDVDVDNPNAVAVDLTGFDYDLKINDRSFLKGEQDRELTIAARDKSAIQIPVTLNYQDLYETFSSLRLQDSTPYQLAGGVSFDLPVLGKSRIPLSTSGEIPAVKLPAFSIDGLKVHTLSLSKAEMELNMSIENSNAFDLFLKSVEYELAIDGKTWAKGLGAQETRIARKGRSSLSIPISLDVGQIVFGISQALSGKKALQYDFRGNFTLGSSLPLLKDATVPLDRSGILNIQR